MTRHPRAAGSVAILMSCAMACAGCNSQGTKDKDLLWAFHNLMVELWNKNIANVAVGPKDITVTSSKGGSVHITGQTTSPSAHSLTYTFTNYDAVVAAGGTLTITSMTGDISESGEWNAGTVTFNSSDLAVNGTFAPDGEDLITLSGALALACSFDTTSSYTTTSGSGSVDGRSTVSWGDNGAGGGGGSSSSDDCSAYTINCGQVTNGIQQTGGVVPQACTCPSGTSPYGVDRTTPGGPYTICNCN